ncbi:universal stress protein [Luteibacter sp. Lutesp34]|uniref:universal stress protein n=1 Tax=Luteibacter sp. Lutesp34 TaxID=3243030 RepID=UPI0039B5740E
MQRSTSGVAPSRFRTSKQAADASSHAFNGIVSILAQEPHDAAVLEAAAHFAPYGEEWRALLPVPLPEHVPCPWGESPVRALAIDHLARRGDAEAHLESLRRSLSRLHAKATCERADCTERQLVDSVLRLVRGAGCVVTGVPLEAAPMQPVAKRWFTHLLLRSGRPTLALPRGATLARRPRRVLVAWSDTPESARALHEALRWLPSGSALRIVTVAGAGHARDVYESTTGASALAGHLASHDTMATFDVLDGQGRPPEDVLLDEARTTSADLIVMGCYGHSHAAEYIFGGVTQALLRRSRVPLLLAH